MARSQRLCCRPEARLEGDCSRLHRRQRQLDLQVFAARHRSPLDTLEDRTDLRSLHPVEQTAAAGTDGHSEAQSALETVPQQASQSAGQPVTNMAARPTVRPDPIVHFDIEVADKHYQVDIPKEAYHILANAISLADTEEFAAGILDMQKTAMLLFAGYVDAATSMAESHGGGGSVPSSGWGRDKDEDEREWARRCAHMAMEMSRPRRRGWRR